MDPMKLKFFLPVLSGAFLFMQSCTPTPDPSEPAQVDFNETNIQHKWTFDKINYYDLTTDAQTSTVNVPAGYYQTYQTDDSLLVEIGSSSLMAHYALGTYMGKNIIIVTSPTQVDTVEVVSLTASTVEFSTKPDVSSTHASGHWEIDYLSR